MLLQGIQKNAISAYCMSHAAETEKIIPREDYFSIFANQTAFSSTICIEERRYNGAADIARYASCGRSV